MDNEKLECAKKNSINLWLLNRVMKPLLEGAEWIHDGNGGSRLGKKDGRKTEENEWRKAEVSGLWCGEQEEKEEGERERLVLMAEWVVVRFPAGSRAWQTKNSVHWHHLMTFSSFHKTLTLNTQHRDMYKFKMIHIQMLRWLIWVLCSANTWKCTIFEQF